MPAEIPIINQNGKCGSRTTNSNIRLTSTPSKAIALRTQQIMGSRVTSKASKGTRTAVHENRSSPRPTSVSRRRASAPSC